MFISTQVLLFVHSPPQPTGVEEEQVSSCMVVVASYQVKP